MKITLISIGTQGDIEPFLAIGELLKTKGYDVLCAFPEQFKNLAIQSDLEFESLGEKFIKLLESEDGKAAMGGASGWRKLIGTIRLAMNQSEANKEVVFNQYRIINDFNPDCILYNGKTTYPILWHLKTKRKIIFISPLPYMHYVKGHTHIAFNSNFGEFFNRLTFSLTEFGLVTTINISKKWLKIKDKFKRSDIKNILRNGNSIYTISPSLFKRPEYWPKTLQVLGYHKKKQNQKLSLSPDLQNFIDNHDKILFITFGSMTNSQPNKKTHIILDILVRHNIPAIINTASGGLIKPKGFNNPHIFFVSQVPYDLIFPKIHGVIHHGGSGTTHLALRYGCASMIIPHIIDQFAWNSLLANLGVGPLGVKINKITTRSLEPKIIELLNNTKFKEKAEEIKAQMAREDFKDKLLNEING
jgi:UDP:flavonoid glycosyltransferase YjiC (YdhE family)